MRTVKRKLSRQGGFTLIEMLLVVAIIAVLIAISIPMVGSALERSRIATDAANERSAKAAMVIKWLSGGKMTFGDMTKPRDSTGAYFYNAASGELVLFTPTMSADYMKNTYTPYGQSQTYNHADKYLWARMDENGTVQLVWSVSVSGTAISGDWNTNLCSPDLMAGK